MRGQENKLLSALSAIIDIGGLLIISVLITIGYIIVYVRALFRYKKTAKAFYDFQKRDDPKLEQFKWSILGLILISPVAAFFWSLINDFIVLNLLPNFHLYREYILLDEAVDPWTSFRRLLLIELTISGLHMYIYSKFWTPEYIEKALRYKANMD